MGLLDGLLKKKDASVMIGSPTDGECISITKVDDPTFAEEILGKGIAVIPQSDKIVAPADGTVSTIFPTGHAFTMETSDGAEVLVHIGIDTVKLEGQFFTKHIEEGTQVKKGDLIIQADFEQIHAAGYDTSVLVVVCNTADYADVEQMTEGAVSASENVIRIRK